MLVICFRKVKNNSLLEPWSFRNSSSCLLSFKIDVNYIETIGSLSQITRPCPIKYKSMNAQHQQVKLDRRQTLTEFIKEGEVKLKSGEQYNLTDMDRCKFCPLQQ
jgi:hypothetical protein